LHAAFAASAHTAIPEYPGYQAAYADFIPGYVYVDGRLYPVCCIPTPGLDDSVAVRVDNGLGVAQFVDYTDQTILQLSGATGQVAAFASVPGIAGIAFDTHNANTYALTSQSLQRFAPTGSQLASAQIQVPYESLTVIKSRSGDSVGAYGQGFVSLFDATSLAPIGTLQLPANTFPPGAPVRIANASGKLYLHADGDDHLIRIDLEPAPWTISRIALRAADPVGLGADANGRLYTSVGGTLAALTAAGKPVITTLTGQPAAADFTIAH
jgi:hypothetical protein